MGLLVGLIGHLSLSLPHYLSLWTEQVHSLTPPLPFTFDTIIARPTPAENHQPLWPAVLTVQSPDRREPLWAPPPLITVTSSPPPAPFFTLFPLSHELNHHHHHWPASPSSSTTTSHSSLPSSNRSPPSTVVTVAARRHHLSPFLLFNHHLTTSSSPFYHHPATCTAVARPSFTAKPPELCATCYFAVAIATIVAWSLALVLGK